MTIPKRALELIDKLGLQPHPEGGYYKETYRSSATIGSKGRAMMTSIYFLLTSENCSRFHRIQSDETWYFHEGDALQIHTLIDGKHHIQHLGLQIQFNEQPYHLVPANTIFGSTIVGEMGYALVSCAVAPGFDFNEFELFTSDELLQQYPNERAIIDRLT